MRGPNIAILLSALALPGCAASLAPPPGPLPGAQLYTLRAAMADDPVAVLRRLAAMGYREVEYAGTFGRPPALLCKETRALGLSVAAAHADWRMLRDDPAAALAEAKALCAPTLVLAWLPEEERRTLAQWRGWIARLNALVPQARAAGIGLAYHAHDFEFRAVEGERPIDLLARELDPAIGFELDTYWVARAGEEVLPFLRRHAGRVTHLHVKDMAAGGAMADPGAGVLPLAAIVAEARRQGVRHYLVERDDAPDPWASLAAGLDSLQAMPFEPD